jgi:hypothetical protein
MPETEKFKTDLSNNVDLLMKDFQIEIRCNQVDKNTLHLIISIFNQKGQVIAKIQRFESME